MIGPRLGARGRAVGAAGVVLAGLAGMLALPPAQRPPAPSAPREGPTLASARSWGYQLQNLRADAISPDIDLLVVDGSRDGSSARALSAAEVVALQTRTDGTRRIVLCYLSIGEAEKYRSYWNEAWESAPPTWLGAENPKWKGNYSVQFWDPAWQRLIVAPQEDANTWGEQLWHAAYPQPQAYLDAIIAAGFDGVLLDRVDSYEKAIAGRPSAKADMIGFVTAISTVAKKRRPGFLIVPQNGEELFADPLYRRVVDGVVKEDLLYGEAGDGLANDPVGTRRAIGELERAKAAGLPAFTVEYLTDAEQKRTASEAWQRLGFVGTFATRALNEPPMVMPSR